MLRRNRTFVDPIRPQPAHREVVAAAAFLLQRSDVVRPAGFEMDRCRLLLGSRVHSRGEVQPATAAISFRLAGLESVLNHNSPPSLLAIQNL